MRTNSEQHIYVHLVKNVTKKGFRIIFQENHAIRKLKTFEEKRIFKTEGI